MFKFRKITSRRYIRVFILGVIGWYTTGGLSVFIWFITVLYGIYVFIVSLIGFITGAGRTNKGFGIPSIFNILLGYVVTGKIIDFVEKKNGNKHLKDIVQDKAKRVIDISKSK